MNLWTLAQKQSAKVATLKNKDAKRRQVVLLCKTLISALKGGA